MLLTTWQIAYLAAWMALCLLAAVLSVVHRREVVLFRSAYWRLLARPWKVAFFVAGLVGIVWMAPHTGDPTWDYYDAGLMAALAYTTAPWAVGVMYRTVRGPRQWTQTFIAAAVWLFGASWSYDGYLVLRDGVYPSSWAANLVASSMLYLMAGLLWSLEDEGGLRYAFQAPSWPDGDGVRWSLRLGLAAAGVATPVAAMFLYMLYAW